MKKLSSWKQLVFLMPAIIIAAASCTHTIEQQQNDNDFFTGGKNECIDGIARDSFPCHNVHLLANVTPAELLGERLNDVWGWTDPQTGFEYALVGLTDGVTFVNVTDPKQPSVIGELSEWKSTAKLDDEEEHDEKSTWRDFKVYSNYLFIVSDGQPHGMQVFDLTRLRNHSGETKVDFSQDLHYQEFNNAHNIAINEETGYAYVAGSDRFGGGLMILDISNPLDPQLVGSHVDTTVGRRLSGYVHDTQCVVYKGPDSKYNGSEICFNSSETALVIANVTDKDSTFTIGKSDYSGRAYVHQGWLTEDHRYFLLDDELDERREFGPTKTYIWDVQDLENPSVIGIFESSNYTIDHNQYVEGNYVYQANYTAGLRILDLADISSGKLVEVAYFDTYPKDNAVEFSGAWSTYPFFGSGIVLVSDINNGLFILGPDL